LVLRHFKAAFVVNFYWRLIFRVGGFYLGIGWALLAFFNTFFV